MTTNELTGAIIGAAIEVHKRLGPGLLQSAYRVCLSAIMCLVVAGCGQKTPPQPKIIKVHNHGGFDPEEQFTVKDVEGLHANYFAFVKWGAARDGRLVYLVIIDVPQSEWKSAIGRDLKFSASFPEPSIDDGTLSIDGEEYSLSKGRVFLLTFFGGPDQVRQTRMPAGAKDPEETLRQLLQDNIEFRGFVRETLRDGLDSVSRRDEAALALYKSGLAAELPRKVLQQKLQDDSSWVRLMAASGLLEATNSAEAREVLTSLAEAEPANGRLAKLAQRELEAKTGAE